MNKQHLQKLLESTQDLFRTTHEHAVNEIVKRDGYFSPFGIGVSADGEYIVAGIENLDSKQALSFAIQVLKDFARQGKLITAATCFAEKIQLSQNDDLVDVIIIILEDTTRTAIKCCGTYRKTASIWEFGDMTGEVGEPIIFDRL
jgi:hypothetical protein